MKVKDLEEILEDWAPLSLQESYDNCGLLVGDSETKITSVLVSLDITEEVVLEAIRRNANMIVAHHPIIFKGLKSLTGDNEVERCIIMAIKSGIALYAIHTNLDNISGGVSHAMGKALGLLNMKTLLPKKAGLFQLVIHVPIEYTKIVSEALFDAGAGKLGSYDQCKFSVQGNTSFRPLKGSNPFNGDVGKLELSTEDRLELIVPVENKERVEKALINIHPYEEISYAWLEMSNSSRDIGFGVIGELETALSDKDFIKKIKEVFGVKAVKHTNSKSNLVQRVALCGGSGSELLPNAIKSNSDAFVTSDISYHRFFDAKKVIFLADIGHWESEQYTIQLITDYIRSKMTNFAVIKTESLTNPITTS
tara:strand:+ start:1122 stop:2216 length:1095 start_codon:yes stop_codon:yes gene_type:complete